MTRARAVAATLVMAASASVVCGLLFGSLDVAPGEALASITKSGVVHDVVWNVRAPRVFAAFACGGLLALAGTLLQVLLRNPLADPYVLGVSSGASLAALVALTVGASAAWINAAAFGGALAAMAILLAIAYGGAEWNVYRLLLAGVVLAAGFSALISLTLVLAPEGHVKGMLYWLMGDLSYADSPLVALALLGALTFGAVSVSLELDLVALGETKARSLGVAVAPLELGLFLAAALATVTVVVIGGAIGFVGLIAPHALRLLGIVRHRALLPLAVLLGGSALTIADTAARVAWAPQQLPVGIFTALLGVPAMLVLLARRG